MSVLPPLKRFNVRVYGLLINPQQQLLVADEAFKSGQKATKFPGGGLELGEGLIEGLKREFVEETGIDVEVKEHFYTTDFFVRSFFELSPDSQIISIYYIVESADWQKIKTSTTKFDFEYIAGKESESFRWVNLSELDAETDIVLPIDKVVVGMLKERIR
ncbi:MAG TPA: NUDIX domain-containing protein [Chitinophagales bacterium]|nr:NUDIX domain-containing protein [Chitinophagales bacterium]